MKHILITFLIICAVFSFRNETYSQAPDLNAWIDSQITQAMDSFNIAGATIVLMEGDSILHIEGYGLADIESNIPVNANSSIVGVGSVSKTFVATAIMQLVEDEKIELDLDVNNYLKSFQLSYKFNQPITVRHLLTHTSGFDVSNIGTAVLEEKDVIPLAQYLKKRIPGQIRPAGKVITYSNLGYALLGLIVEEVSGMPFYEYVKQRILQPLEMNFSGFKKNADLKENYVTSYLQKGGQLIPYQTDFLLSYPAGSFSTTASDMGNYISMFLNNGIFKSDKILDSATITQMFHSPFRHYEKARYGWLLGFQESYWNGVGLYGHGGEINGFESQLSLIPERNAGLFISVNASSYPNSKSRIFIDNFIYDLLSKLMPECISEEKEPQKSMPAIGSVAEPLEKFEGIYRYTNYGYKTFEKLGILIGLAPEIEILSTKDGLEILPWNGKFFPVSELTFQSDDDRYIAFDRDMKGEISYFFIEAFAYHKLKWYEPVKFQVFWIGSIILIFLFYIISRAVGKLFVRNRKSHPIKKISFSLATLVVLFIAVLAYGLKTTDPMEFFYGIPLLIKGALVLPFIIIPMDFTVIWLLIKAIRFKEMRTFDLLSQSVIVLAALFFIPWLMYYNLIGFNY